MLRSLGCLPVCIIILSTAAARDADATPPKLRAPAGGETWSVGSQHFIEWEPMTDKPVDTVRLQISTDGGKQWTDIEAPVPNSGRFLWTVPARVSDTCTVRVTGPQPGVTADSAAFAIVASQAVADYEWRKVTLKAEFAPRDGAGALVFKGRMWLFGGWNPGDKKAFPRICNNEVWSSADGARWTLEKPNTFLDQTFDPVRDWEGRHTGGYVVYKEKMWLVGGDGNQGHYQEDVWNSADGKTWTLVTRDKRVPWAPRVLHYTLVFRDKIWVMGGQTIPRIAQAEEFFHRDIWTSTDGASWERVMPKEPYWPQRGMIGGSIVFKDRVWILGGGTYDTPKVPERKFFNDVWSSADGIVWKRHVEHAPWQGRQYHDVAVFDDRMWVLEGYSQPGGNRNDVWYSANGVNWYEVPQTPWKPRHAASVFIHDGGLWMVAGNNMESDVWKLQRSARK
jgi:hypothetical protein